MIVCHPNAAMATSKEMSSSVLDPNPTKHLLISLSLLLTFCNDLVSFGLGDTLDEDQSLLWSVSDTFQSVEPSLCQLLAVGGTDTI